MCGALAVSRFIFPHWCICVCACVCVGRDVSVPLTNETPGMEPAGILNRSRKLLHALFELRSGLKISKKLNISRAYIIKVP